MEILKGKIENCEKQFILIKTSEDNFDGKYEVVAFNLNESYKLDFDEEEVKMIDNLYIGQHLCFGCGMDKQVVRLG